jgi:PAS domain S-box-containing protein
MAADEPTTRDQEPHPARGGPSASGPLSVALLFTGTVLGFALWVADLLGSGWAAPLIPAACLGAVAGPLLARAVFRRQHGARTADAVLASPHGPLRIALLGSLVLLGIFASAGFLRETAAVQGTRALQRLQGLVGHQLALQQRLALLASQQPLGANVRAEALVLREHVQSEGARADDEVATLVPEARALAAPLAAAWLQAVGAREALVADVGAALAEARPPSTAGLRERADACLQALEHTGSLARTALDANAEQAVRRIGTLLLSLLALLTVVYAFLLRPTLRHLGEQHAEQARRAEHIRATGDLASVGAWELPLDTMKPWWSDQVRRIHEVSDDFEPDLASAIAFYHVDDRARITAAVQRAIAHGEPYDEEFRFTTAKGNARIVRSIGRAVREGDRTVRLWGVFQDVTANVHARQRASEQAARLELIAQGAGLGTWDWNIATGEVHLNPIWAQMLGYRPDEVEPNLRSWERLVHPGDLARVRRVLQAHLDGAAAEYRCTYRRQRRDGSWAYVHDAGRVIERDAAGAPRRAAGVQVDVTTQLESQRRAERLQRAIDVAADAVFLTDPDGTIVQVNAAFAQMTGYAEQEVVGRRPSILKSGLHDQALYKDMWDTIRRGDPWHGRIANRRKDTYVAVAGSGSELRSETRALVYWVDVSITPLRGEDGEIDGYLAMERDVTAQVASESNERLAHADAEARLATAAALAAEGPLREVLQGALEAMFAMPGLETQRAAAVFLLDETGRRLELFAEQGAFAPGLLAAAEGPLGRGVCGRAASSREIDVTDDCTGEPWQLDGPAPAPAHGRYVVPIAPRAGFAGSCLGALLIHTDPYPIATQARLEALAGIGDLLATALMQERAMSMAQQARHHAEAATRAKSEFLANVSHEIRTPLTAILGFTDLLAEEVDGRVSAAQRAEHVATIRRNGQHLLAVLNDVLDLSKIEAGRMEIERIDTDPLRVVDDVLQLMQVNAAAKGLELRVIRENAIPLRIASDPVRLHQILLNLLGNAIKFTARGAITVRLRLERGQTATPLLRIAVTDTGIGMTAEQCRRLFAPFAQADASMARRYGGTGLGLRISRLLAELLGGGIDVQSEKDRGSTFTVTIPTGPLEGIARVDPGTAGPPAAAAAPAADDGRAARPLRGVRILVAEDGLDNQRLIGFHLRRAGAEVVLVENGRQLVEALTADGSLAGPLRDRPPFGLVVTDMQMPELDGYAATRLLREKGCELPIVALTAHSMSGDAERCRAAGCDGYATKPIDRTRLLEMCRAAAAGELRPPPPPGAPPPGTAGA